jgi:hypothetical protein
VSARFDAATDRVFYLGGAGDPPDVFTIALWVYVVTDLDNYSSLYRRYTSGGSGRGQLGTDNDGISLMWWPTGVDFLHDMAEGQWTWVAAVVEGGAVDTFASDVLGALSTNTGSAGTVAGANLITLSGVSEGNGDEWLNGRIAYVRTWAAALTPTELEAEFASTVPVRTADLWADWPLGGDLLDHSGNGRHLTAGATAVSWEANPPLDEPEPVPEATVTLPVVVGVVAEATAPAATVPTATVALPVGIGVAAAATTPPAAVPAASVALPLSLAVQPAGAVPTPSVPEAALLLPIAIALTPEAVRPPASVPTAATVIPVVLGVHPAASSGEQHDITLTAVLAAQETASVSVGAPRWTATLGDQP